jgi:prophage endopeptidase
VSRLTAIITSVIILLIVSLVWLANHYHDNAVEFKSQRDAATKTIDKMKSDQKTVRDIDKRYTGELNDAKNKLADLQRCVSSGKCGLRINASCPKAGAERVDDGDTITTDRVFEQDYFRLRNGIETTTKQLEALQDYVKNVCLK